MDQPFSPCHAGPGVEDMTGSLCAARLGRIYGHLTLLASVYVYDEV